MNVKQRKILLKLVKQNELRFSALQRGFSVEDKFPYHLKQLVTKGYVNKRDECYFLTKLGMRQTAYFDGRTLEEYDLKIPRLVFICKDSNLFRLTIFEEFGDAERKWYVLPAGNAVVGETVREACIRLLKSNYGIVGKAAYRATRHFVHYTSDGDILFDDILLVFDVRVTSRSKPSAKWFNLNEINELTNRHPLIDQFILKNDRRPFSEDSFTQNFGFALEDLSPR